MFSRSLFRSAAPLKRGIRSYATEGGAGGSSTTTMLGYAGGAALITGGAAFAYQNFGGKAAEVASREMSGPAPKAFQGGDQGFISLKVKSTEDLSHNTRKVTFSLPESNMISGLPVASAVVTKVQKEGDEKPTIRPYTPTSEVDERGFVEFVIKKYPDGPMSEHIHSLKEGDELEIKGPIPKYQVEQNMHKQVAMIAGGTGITPMYQILRKILQDPNDKTKISLVFGNVKEEDILLRKELAEFENTYPQRFRVFYTLDQPPEGWEQGKGFITQELLKTVLPEPKEENIKIFVCGPPGLYKAVSGTKKGPQDQGELSGILKEMGYSQDQVFKF